MEIQQRGSKPSAKGPADYFTGNVRVDSLFEAPAPGTFTPVLAINLSFYSIEKRNC
jgi:hypothetical protein